MARKNNKSCLPGRQHFWVIEIPNGPQSRGVCQYCKREGWYENYVGMGNDYERHELWKKYGIDRLSGVL